MNIIFISNNMAKARTLSVMHVSLIVATLILLPVLITLLFIVPQDAATQKGIKSFIPAKFKFAFNYHQKHLDAYAIQLGEMQARVMRLDAQSERLSKLANKEEVGHAEAEQKSRNAPSSGEALNRGGPLLLDSPLSEAELQKRIAQLLVQIELKTDYLSNLEAKLLQQSVFKNMLPNISPIAAAFNSSSFGWRLDPFNGHKAFHEGLDFTAALGTSIYAAAGGIVSTSEQTPDYGKIIKINHGSGLETRYAHASLLLVKVGDRVEKGQKIAEVGSTGRSTGPHLHYEIRLNGNALDPRQYLKASI